MVIFLLISILFAILYSTEQGKGLMKEVFLFPFKIIRYPFRFFGEAIRDAKEENDTKEQQRLSLNFKKSLTKEELDLIREEFILEPYFNDIREQISLYRKFKEGKIYKGYLKPEALLFADGNNSLYIIKSEKVEELRKTLF